MSSRAGGVILERALLGALAGMLPLPFVDDFLLRRARRSLLREVATGAGLALDERSLEVLAAEGRASFLRSAGRGLASRLMRSTALPIRISGRARAALETFTLATLLDHYARAHHRGPRSLDVERARALRAAFAEVARDTPVGLAAVRSPKSYADALRAGFDTRWASRSEAVT